MIERIAACALVTMVPAAAGLGGDPIEFEEQTLVRLVADPSVGVHDPDEKHYAWNDVDHDGDDDLVIVRSPPGTVSGGRRNVLLLNEGGVLVDRTAEFIGGFLDGTNDRDVVLLDVNNDGWTDIVTAAACHLGCTPGIATESRLYPNLGDDGQGTWLGYGPPGVLLGGDGNRIEVAAGDVTGDGYADLYFVSAVDTSEDQLLINVGPADPGVFTSGNDRLTAEMRQSAFATGAVIADVNGDSFNDLIKSENGPVEIFRNSGVNGPGQFDLIDVTYSGAAYHVAAGNLNGDGMIDLVIVDDGFDRYILNDGDIFDGQPEPALVFPGTTGGFESRSLIADIDGDAWNDVIVSSVSVDLPGCQKDLAIFRNKANPPTVTFTLDLGNLPTTSLDGVFDTAALDIDADGDLDLVLGRCAGTEIWMQVKPCPWDLDGDGGAGINDFLAVLGAWGTDPGGPPDFDGDGTVGIADLLELLAHWGPCR